MSQLTLITVDEQGAIFVIFLKVFRIIKLKLRNSFFNIMQLWETGVLPPCLSNLISIMWIKWIKHIILHQFTLIYLFITFTLIYLFITFTLIYIFITFTQFYFQLDYSPTPAYNTAKSILGLLSLLLHSHFFIVCFVFFSRPSSNMKNSAISHWIFLKFCMIQNYTCPLRYI